MRGAQVVVKALEDEGVGFTFGIPGTHNIELYDALESSKKIEPVLVTDEQSASFMADGVSRTSDTLGVVAVVPGAGISHALSGIAGPCWSWRRVFAPTRARPTRCTPSISWRC
jgi:acetolactate synthase-1/2/3 large subunit